MNLPYNLKLKPGVMTDHNGRKFVYGQYPSGKVVPVYIQQDPNAPAARMIPVPKEPERGTGLKRGPLTTGVKERRTLKLPERVMKIRYRYAGENEVKTFTSDNHTGQHLVNHDFRPLMRWTGKEWVAIESRGDADYFVQWHEDKEVA